MIINTKEWENIIKQPDWYIFFQKVLDDLQNTKKVNINLYEEEKEKIYDFFEDHLSRGDIYLGKSGKNWDNERRPIDTIVIHHTSNKPGLTKERLSAIELFRLYGPAYAGEKYKKDSEVYRQPVYSGHFRNGKQIFFVYHWIVRNNGDVEQLLTDNEIGWQSGNWDVNCRSISIVFDNDFENSKPSLIELKAAANIIKNKYPNVKNEKIYGHREINPNTTCPSNLFLSNNNYRGWKEDLLTLIKK